MLWERAPLLLHLARLENNRLDALATARTARDAQRRAADQLKQGKGQKASQDARVAADAAYSAAVAAAEAAATKQCADAKKSIAKDELRKAAILPTANRYTMEYAASSPT